jgi:hypothetical protein
VEVLPGASRKAAKCEHGKGATGRHRAESPSEPASSVQGAPKFAIHVPALSPGGMAPDYWSHWPVDWFKGDWGDRKVRDTPRLTK